MNDEKKTKQHQLKLVIIGGLIMLYFSFFLSFDCFSRKNLAFFLLYINPHHWQTWYAINFWLLVIGKATTIILSWIRLRWNDNSLSIAGKFVWSCVFAGIVLTTLSYAKWFEPLRYFLMAHRYFLYQYIYVPYFYAPLTELIYNGGFTWKLFCTPMILLLIVTGLLRVNKRMKTKGKNNDR
ncbi:MAG: hypothetical protein LBJ67_14585 [Planctomycetaceae bacterium]|jgi:hypothetical protein|nr:hypothetical protein [Planctomycetaceae bacterium]